MKPRNPGFALIVTLAVLVLVTVMVVGLLVSVKLDREASQSHLAGTRAELAAAWGIEEVVATLRKYTANPDIGWVSQPGRLVVSDASGNAATRELLAHEIALSPGAPSETPGAGLLAPANLNVRMLEGDGTHGVLMPDTAPALLKWVYIRQDGTPDLSETPDLTDRANPIVARCAYWADDDATRLNLNLAWKREQTPPAPLNDPGRVNLEALLTPELAQLLHDRVSATPLNSTLEARQAGDAVQAALDARQFDITHYNHSPLPRADLFWLTTDENLMNAMRDQGILSEVKKAQNTASTTGGLPNFIDIRTSPDKDPGYLPYIWNSGGDAFRLNKSILAIRAQLLRTDWPTFPGKSLIGKWYGSGLSTAERNMIAEQIALNLIDYVRLRESRAKLVPPVMARRASQTATASSFSFSSYRTGMSTTMYLGGIEVSASRLFKAVNHPDTRFIMPGRSPVITEMTMVIDETPVTRAGEGNPAGYWPTIKTPAPPPTDPGESPGRFTDGVHLNGSVTGGASGPVPLYRCKVYIELYLPAYEGLPEDFEIDFGATGEAAWPGGAAEFPPSDVFPHTGYASDTLEAKGKWFLGLPDEISLVPDRLKLNPAEDANTVGVSTDGRNHLTYYFKNAGDTRLTAATYGGIYADGNNYQPLSWENYEIPLLRSVDFIGGSSGSKLRPGQRIVIARQFYRTGAKALRPGAEMRASVAFGVPTNFGNQSGLSASAHAPFAIAVAPVSGPVPIDLQVVSSSAFDNDNLSGVKSLQVNDPRMGWDPDQWVWEDQSFGEENPGSALGKAPAAGSADAPQDTDAAGLVTGHSVYKAAPPASAEGSSGRVESPGELGVIHTGLSPVTGHAVPWRTLRLQPALEAGAEDEVPDWLLLSAFAIPPREFPGATRLRTPNPHARSGVVNLNTTVYPQGLAAVPRGGGVAGILTGAPKEPSTPFTAEEAWEVAAQIASHTLADGDHAGRSFGFANVLDYPAEVVEIKGVADRGEESEEVVRDLLALSSSRGNVFSVFAIGQALRQTPGGELRMLAEKRTRTTVERVETGGGQVRFRVVYSRDLHP